MNDSLDLLEKIKYLEVEKKSMILTFDIEKLYTNIQITVSIQILKYNISNNIINHLRHYETIKNLFTSILFSNFKRQITYKQMD